MTITLELSAEQEHELTRGAASHDAEQVRQVLLQAVDSAVAKILQRPPRGPSPEEFNRLLDSLVRKFADAPSLPDEALSRDAIYADHP